VTLSDAEMVQERPLSKWGGQNMASMLRMVQKGFRVYKGGWWVPAVCSGRICRTGEF